jgi:hypothetical protein
MKKIYYKIIISGLAFMSLVKKVNKYMKQVTFLAKFAFVCLLISWVSLITLLFCGDIRNIGPVGSIAGLFSSVGFSLTILLGVGANLFIFIEKRRKNVLLKGRLLATLSIVFGICGFVCFAIWIMRSIPIHIHNEGDFIMPISTNSALN